MTSAVMDNDHLKKTIGHLPVTAVLEKLQSALTNKGTAVLVAPPGAGKTTVVPLALLDEPWLAGLRILLLVPRRLAARASARRMAALLGQAVGQTVGYRVRLERRVSSQTRIEVITEGILTRMLQTDPSLEGVGLVIFDEFHERSLDADLGLALCREVRSVFNETLRLLVMSATLDPAPVADLLDGAPLVACDGRAFDVQTRHMPLRASIPIERAVADTILQSVKADEGSILVFLPGVPEIRRVARLLADVRLPDHWAVAPLFGSLPRDRQDAAIAPLPEGRKKIVLATSVAETSLTIEQIRVVVDSGLQRAPRFDPRTGMARLVTLPVSQASADQRRGRAGRLAPGICYRLWSEAVHASLPAQNRPEILAADLAGLALELALWGESEPDTLGWLDPPPAGAYAQARMLLTDLGALDDKGRITAHGRRVAELPLHPRLAHMLMRAHEAGQTGAACALAAILSERDPVRFKGSERDADLRMRLDLLNAFKARRPLGVPEGNVDRGALRRIMGVAAQLQQRLGGGKKRASPPDVGQLLAWAYPDRIACRRPDGVGRYLMTNGRGAYFDPPDPLSVHEFLVVAELDGERRDAPIYIAAAYDRETLLEQFDHRLQWHETVAWDEQRRMVTAERRLCLGALILKQAALTEPDPQALIDVMIAALRRAGVGVLPWTRTLRLWQARVVLIRRVLTEAADWPDLSDQGLTADLERWLGHYLAGVTSFKALARIDLANALRSRLNWQQVQQLDRWAPTHIEVPSGSRRPIDYSGDAPVLAVRLQEMFGAVDTPVIADGRLPLLLHLLSPAGRPAQITQDLAGFWRNSYPAVKKELKGRYPKHYWPDDPLTAQPTARVRPART